MKYFIKTFGCQQNTADSERIAADFAARNYHKAHSYQNADVVVINTCMIRKSAENRVYGLVNNLAKIKKTKPQLKIIVTGCMVGMAYRDKSGKFLKRLKIIMPEVDEFIPIQEVGFHHEPIRQNKDIALVPISNGCNNYCTYCVVPFARGKEISRPFQEILTECQKLLKKGYSEIILLGQNVNSYGADLIKKGNSNPDLEPVYVRHLGRLRLPTLFPHLLEAVAKLGFKKVDFISSNPWDFSNELVSTIAKHPNITRTLHLPVQSGDDKVLKRMNRWYTATEYLALVNKIKKAIPEIQFTTDIIVGFCGETDKEYKNTEKLCQKVNFQKAYIAMYSSRPFTAASKIFKDDVPFVIKKKRWNKLDTLVNKYPH
jgi:tRNA-2-methylthio-N6-dimethylallyladenosine synthase